MKKEIKNEKPISVARFLVESYYDHQRVRLETYNRVRAIVIQKYGGKKKTKEKFAKEFADKDLSKKLEKLSKRKSLTAEEKAKVLQLKDIMDTTADLESAFTKAISTEVKQEQIWKEWLKDVKGVGPILGGCLVSWLGYAEQSNTVSQLWAYCGLGVGYYKAECEKGHKYLLSGEPNGRTCWTLSEGAEGVCGAKFKTLERVSGEVIRRMKGYKLGYSPRLKTLCWKISDSFVKVKGPYRNAYDNAKKYYQNRKDLKGESKGHIHAMAKRKAVKLFLSHYYAKGREMKGLDVRDPYPIEKQGHKRHIKP